MPVRSFSLLTHALVWHGPGGVSFPRLQDCSGWFRLPLASVVWPMLQWGYYLQIPAWDLHTVPFGKDSLYVGKLAGKCSTLAGTEMLVTKFTKIACCTFRDRQHMNFLIAGRNLVTVWFSRLRSVNNYSLWVWFKSLKFPNTKTMCRLCALFFCILMLYCTSLSEVKGLGTSSHPHSIY